MSDDDRSSQVSGHGEKLNRRKEAAIAALLIASTLPDAAMAAGVSVATLRRWLQIPEFRRAYEAARAEVVERAIGRLEAQAGEAAETLIRNLRSGRPAAEIRAAVALLEYCLVDRFLSREGEHEGTQPDRIIHITVKESSDATQGQQAPPTTTAG